MVTEHQPVTLAAMEGLFQGQSGAPLVIIGQPNDQTGKIDNPLQVPEMLSMLTYRRWTRMSADSTRFRGRTGRETFLFFITAITSWLAWGRFFIAVMVVSALLLWRGKFLMRGGCSGS